MARQVRSQWDMNNNKIVNLLDPTNPQDAATKFYVDAVKTGLDIKDSVRVATDVAGTLATDYENGDTLDGVTLVTGDRILIKNQAAGAENGIYTVNATGAPTRSIDADADAEVTSGLFTFVEEGTAGANSGWVLATANPIVVGTTALTFTQFSGAGAITAGTGLTQTGSTINAVGINGITANADDLELGGTLTKNTVFTHTAGSTTLSLATPTLTFSDGTDNIAIDQNSITLTDGTNTTGLNIDLSGFGAGSAVISATGGGSLVLDSTSGDIVLQDNTIFNGTTMTWSNRLSTTDDTGTFAPVNFLYTDTAGIMYSAPTSALGFTLAGTTGSEAVAPGNTVTVAGGDLLTTAVTATDTVTIDWDAATLTAGDILYSDGTNMLTLGIGTAGQVLTTNAGATAPEWTAGTFTLAGDTGTNQTITLGDTLTVAGGEGLASVGSATDTVTVALDVSNLTAETTVASATDVVAIYDVSATAHRKMTVDNLLKGWGYAETITPVASVATTITHNLNTLDVDITVVDVATGETVEVDETRNAVNTVQITSSTTAQIRVLVRRVV